MLRSSTLPEHPFSTIYRLAKAKDEHALREFLAQGFCIDIVLNNETPISLLAYENEHTAVRLLIRKFNSSPDYAMEGYARRKNTEKVNSYLAAGASKKFAIYGYARGGHLAEVKLLVLQPDYCHSHLYAAMIGFGHGQHTAYAQQLYVYFKSILDINDFYHYLTIGYIYGNHIRKIEDILREDPTNTNVLSAIEVLQGRLDTFNSLPPNDVHSEELITLYLITGQFEHIQTLCEKGKREKIRAITAFAYLGFTTGTDISPAFHISPLGTAFSPAIHGYAENMHLDAMNQYLFNNQIDTSDKRAVVRLLADRTNKLNALRILSHIHDSETRTLLLRHIGGNEWLTETEQHQLATATNNIRRLMQMANIDFDQACVLLTKGTAAWLMYGVSLVIDGNMPATIFIKISASLTGYPTAETAEIALDIQERITQHASQVVKSLFVQGLFAQAIRDTKLKTIESHGNQRKAFYLSCIK